MILEFALRLTAQKRIEMLSHYHHHWLLWDADAWLTASKSFILITKPQLPSQFKGQHIFNIFIWHPINCSAAVDQIFTSNHVMNFTLHTFTVWQIVNEVSHLYEPCESLMEMYEEELIARDIPVIVRASVANCFYWIKLPIMIVGRIRWA